MARQHLSADADCHKGASHPTQSRAQEATRCGAVTTGLHSRPLGQGDQHSQATSGSGKPGPPPLSQSHQERATDVSSVLLPP